MEFDDGLSSDERAENEVLLQAQVDHMRWRAERTELPRLTPRRALRRIFCSHRSRGGTVDDEMSVSWCLDCGHTEISLAPLPPDDRWLPEGKPAWSSAEAKPGPVSSIGSFLLLAYVLVCVLAVALGTLR